MLKPTALRVYCTAAAMAHAGSAYAYIDPGTGAYLMQVLMAIFGAALFYAGHPVRWLKSVLKRKKPKPESAADTTPPS